MKKYYSVDRIEGKIAVLISDGDKNRINVDISLLPNISESDILFFDGEKYLKDDNEKSVRIKRIESKLSKLNVKNKTTEW